MKMSFKSVLLSLVTAAAVITAFPEHARADLCITSVRMEGSHASVGTMDLSENDEFGFYNASDVTSIRCEDLSAWKNVTAVTSISIHVMGIAALCTGAGAPLTIGLAVAAGGMMFADAIIDNIPCDNSEADEKIEKRVYQKVCEDLAQQGIFCNGGTSQKLMFHTAPQNQGYQSI